MLRGNTKLIICGMLILLPAGPGVQAGWTDWLQKLDGAAPTGSSTATGVAALSEAEIIAGLKEALNVGIERATSLLGQEGGFLNDATVRIPIPESLRQVERALRSVGQEALADDFLMSMNRAAEKATPATTSILVDTVKGMSLDDARSILSGPDDAATQYFRRTNEAKLRDTILPIIQDATAQTGVTATYKRMTGSLGFLSQFTDPDSLDLDRYVTQKALDGLFFKLAQEEELIRRDPLARSTELLKKVFAN
jgi:hypothetical protein